MKMKPTTDKINITKVGDIYYVESKYNALYKLRCPCCDKEYTIKEMDTYTDNRPKSNKEIWDKLSN